MGIFARAVVTGFGFSLGSALFKRVSKSLGLEEKVEETDSDSEVDADAADGDPNNDDTTS